MREKFDISWKKTCHSIESRISNWGQPIAFYRSLATTVQNIPNQFRFNNMQNVPVSVLCYFFQYPIKNYAVRSMTRQQHVQKEKFNQCILKASVVIGTDCIGSCKCNYHTIMTKAILTQKIAGSIVLFYYFKC
jgi:hypothetical protein